MYVVWVRFSSCKSIEAAVNEQMCACVAKRRECRQYRGAKRALHHHRRAQNHWHCHCHDFTEGTRFGCCRLCSPFWIKIGAAKPVLRTSYVQRCSTVAYDGRMKEIISGNCCLMMMMMLLLMRDWQAVYRANQPNLFDCFVDQMRRICGSVDTQYALTTTHQLPLYINLCYFCAANSCTRPLSNGTMIIMMWWISRLVDQVLVVEGPEIKLYTVILEVTRN